MAFSAGSVSAPQAPQSGQPAILNKSKSVAGVMSEIPVVDRGTMGQNTGNPYGIAGQVGPSINIGTAARALRGREVPAIVEIERRINPQYGIHGRQQQIPGKEQPSGTLWYNLFRLRGREEMRDPESLARKGLPSLLAGGQAKGVGMQDTTRSSQLLNESPAPTRIPRLWNDGLNAAAGLSQYGFTQQNYRLFIKHPWLGRVAYPTRGLRAVSGVRAQMSSASTIRIPAIFVPSAVG